MIIARILAVDDNPNILKLYPILLQTASENVEQKKFSTMVGSLFSESKDDTGEEEGIFSYRLSLCSQGKEAIHEVKKSMKTTLPFRLAFLDMRMPPGLDGLETAREILEIDPRIEIVFVTAHMDNDRKEISRTLKNQQFLLLKKPFAGDEIRQLADSMAFRWETAREKERFAREKEIFVQNMSHELRQPLQVILGACDTLLNFEIEKQQRNEFIRNIETEARRLITLTEKLELSGSYVSPQKFQPIPLVSFITKKILLLKPEAEQKDLKLSLEGKHAEYWIEGDEESLAQVFIHLITNGIQYTDEGSVRVYLKKQEKEVIVKIQDTGIGIPFEEQETIFEKFSRAQQSFLEVRGHGMGLNLAREIIRFHGSVLKVESQPGKGSAFSFSLALSSRDTERTDP